MNKYNNKVYVNVCNNIKMFSILENTNQIKEKINNRRIKKVINFFLMLKYQIYTSANIIKEVKFENNKMYIIYTKRFDKRFVRKAEKNIGKIIKNNNCLIVLSKTLINILKLSENKYVKECINSNKNDKTQLKKHIYQVIEKVIKTRNETVEQNNIYVLIKSNNVEYREMLVEMSLKYKSLNIVTNNIQAFKSIESYIYEKYGIFITISNNKRKSLLRAKYILNINYNEKEINEFNIERKSIIFNSSENQIRKIRGFDGIIINNVETRYIRKKCIKQNEYKYNRKQIISSNFFDNMNKNDLQPIIADFIGNNGIITGKEIKNV